jgi:hypothetical protein
MELRGELSRPIKDKTRPASPAPADDPVRCASRPNGVQAFSRQMDGDHHQAAQSTYSGRVIPSIATVYHIDFTGFVKPFPQSPPHIGVMHSL